MEPEENDDLKFENELEKLKQQGEFGGKFFEGNADIPPELEAEWLKNVRAYEESYQNAPKKKVGEIIGNPVFTPVSEIDPALIEVELEKIFELLAANNIALDYNDDVPASEIYRFVTEELINHEMDVMDIPGMVNHFIYEEFYPNHAKDIFRQCDSFLIQLFDKKDENLDMKLDRGLVFANGTIMDETEFIEKAKRWFDSYECFRVNKLAYMAPVFDLEQEMGHIDAWFDYDCVLQDGSFTNFSGPGIVYVHYIYGSWLICGMDFPGFKEWALN